MKNLVRTIWNKVAGWIDAALEFYEWWIDLPGPDNRFAKPDQILPSREKPVARNKSARH